jgi:S-adenosylmethionine hydrolase
LYVCGPNAGYSFALIKKGIEEFYVYQQMDKGSQFRSRDLYMKICALLLNDKQDEMELEESHTNLIPELSGFYIGHIDNYGNIKTTIPHSYLKGKYEYGDMIEVHTHTVQKKAKYVSNLFGGVPGELVIYPGSSGDPNDPFMEISVWRHFTEKETATGAKIFNNPPEGIKVEIK